MPSLSIQRLEALLQRRKLDNTLARHVDRDIRAVLPTGMVWLDTPLGGGWPRGEISELVGPRSSGRTSLLVATLAAATRRGGIAGLVDALDRFDPLTASRAGLDLDRVLWVRGSGLRPNFELRTSNFELSTRACLARAVRQAVRVFDLIVRAGGFAVVALDLGDVPPRAIGVLPFTTWLRLAHANEGRETVGLLVGDAPMGRSARGRTVRVTARPCWSGSSAQSRRFAGFDIRVSV